MKIKTVAFSKFSKLLLLIYSKSLGSSNFFKDVICLHLLFSEFHINILFVEEVSGARRSYNQRCAAFNGI